MTFVLGTAAAAMLARAGEFDVLPAVPEEVLIAEPTYERLVASAPDRPPATAVVRVGEDEGFRVVPVTNDDTFERLRRNDRLSDPDAAAVALADLVDGVAVVDEQYLETLATAESVATTTLPRLLLAATADGDLRPPRALDAFDDLLAAGWHGRSDLYATFIRALDAQS
ncbi:hypothetical protein [Haloparvum sp. AD34]